MRRILREAIGCAIAIATLGHASVALAENSETFLSRARLLGGGMSGDARYEEQTRDGRLFKKFQVDIENAGSFQTVPIFVNGRFMTVVTTNPAGRARVIFRNDEFVGSPSDGMPLPPNFHSLRTGDVVTAGTAAGVVFDHRGGNGIPDPEDQQGVVVRGRVEGNGPSEVKGDIEFRTRKEHGEPLERVFIADLRNIPPFETVQIRFNHEVIATATGDADGNARIVMRTESHIDDPDDGEPMPGSFPTLDRGNVLKIDGTKVTLERGSLDDE